MKKSDLVSNVASAAVLSNRQADEAVSATFEHITNALARGESFNLAGFGSFVVKTRQARTGRNPQTGESIEIAECRQVGFKAGKSLREGLN
ncbi:MAG: HU family DNA-binding protein [Agarilytica sp.]